MISIGVGPPRRAVVKNARAAAVLRRGDTRTWITCRSLIDVSISPDGRYIATSGKPPRLTVWDTRTFRQVGIPLPLDVNATNALARFAPDGRLVMTSGSTLRAFTIDPDAWLARACREARRTLTRTEFEEVLPGRPYRPACA
jgi:WD40 repeat protein